MKLDITMRKASTQRTYQEDTKSGKSEDITKIKGDGNIGGLKVLNDRYPPDLMFKDVDNLIGVVGQDHSAFINFMNLFFNGNLPYDGFWLNNTHKMSQPKAWHIKGAYFDEEQIKLSRALHHMYEQGMIELPKILREEFEL